LGSSNWCHGEMLWQSYSYVWTIKWWPIVGGASRDSCNKDRSLISPEGYRNDRRLMQVLEVEKKGKREKNTNPSFNVEMLYLLVFLFGFIYMNSPYLRVWR